MISNVRETLIDILTDINPDIDFETADNLIDDNLLDSFDIVTLVGEMNDAFDISITVVDLIPENFNSVDAMLALADRLRNA